MEVSALKHAGVAARHGRSPLLRLQSDERLIALTRRGNNGAFEALVGRYQARLLAFSRHMLASKEDAEDVLQEVFAAAFNAIHADERPINVRPWLYRIARNRSLNHLRRAQPIGVDSMDVHFAEHGISTADKAHRREDFRLLMSDVGRLSESQRTALLLRELDALSYEGIAEAMETTVPSVKSLLVRARVSLAEAAEARQLSCEDVRLELGHAAEGLVKLSPPVRRHVKACERCSAFRTQLRNTNKALAAVLPVGPLLLAKKLFLVHLGTHAGAHSGAATGAVGAGSSAAGSATGAGALGTGAASAGTAGAGAFTGVGATAAAGGAGGGLLGAGVGAVATKAVAGLAAAAVVTAGAVEVNRVVEHPSQSAPSAVATAPARSAAVTPRPRPAGPRLATKHTGVVRLSPVARPAAHATPVETTVEPLGAPPASATPPSTPAPPPGSVPPVPAPGVTPVPPVRTETDADTTTLPSPAPPATTPTTTTVPATPPSTTADPSEPPVPIASPPAGNPTGTPPPSVPTPPPPAGTGTAVPGVPALPVPPAP